MPLSNYIIRFRLDDATDMTRAVEGTSWQDAERNLCLGFAGHRVDVQIVRNRAGCVFYSTLPAIAPDPRIGPAMDENFEVIDPNEGVSRLDS